MRYNQDDLLNLPVGKLIDIIMTLQTELDIAAESTLKLARIERIINDSPIRRGRPAYTPEQRAAAYEKYKAKKREEYAEKKKKGEE